MIAVSSQLASRRLSGAAIPANRAQDAVMVAGVAEEPDDAGTPTLQVASGEWSPL